VTANADVLQTETGAGEYDHRPTRSRTLDHQPQFARTLRILPGVVAPEARPERAQFGGGANANNAYNVTVFRENNTVTVGRPRM